jgi:hypothetical protein
LHERGYSLQANRKTREGGEQTNRDAQFEHLNAQAEASLSAGDPVISVDAKKKERIGDFKNGGREWHPQGELEQVRVSDFPIPERGRATPYGVSDRAHHAGRVTVGIDHDPAAFAVESIRGWWNEVGKREYAEAKRLLISADGGGSNGSRVGLWTWELQRLADETGRSIMVCHLPPGTSTWNTIEYRLFSFISQNWRGKPLFTYEVIITLIAAIRTTKGLTVQSFLDTNTSPLGRTLSDEDMAPLRVLHHDFHGEWNSTSVPRTPSV